MKKKDQSQRKRRQSARRELRVVHAKRRGNARKKKVECASPPWLRIVPSAIEDDPTTNVSRELFLLRKGRRQPRDLDLFIPESKLRSR
jgi:hypothetical protein